MAFTSAVIPSDPPRDPARYRKEVDFTRGLKGYLLNGSIFSGLALVLLISVFSGPFETGLLVFKIFFFALFGYLGVRLFLVYARSRRERERAFASGVLCRGTVVSHGRTFVTWKSGRDYTLIVQVKREDGKVLEKKIRSADSALHESHPLHDEIDLLVDPLTGSIFIPAEAGLAASFE